MYNRLYYAVYIIILYSSIIFSQNSSFVSKLDKSQLDLNYYKKLKDKNIILNVCNWREYIANGYLLLNYSICSYRRAFRAFYF